MSISRSKSPEADLVLGELNHRFLNHLQILGSLTSLHSGRNARRQLDRIRDCITALGTVHRILCAPDLPTFVDGSEAICASLVQAVGRRATFSIIVEDEPGDGAIRRDLLLLLSELVTNALKHAAAGRLIVTVTLRHGTGDWSLEVVNSTRGGTGSPRVAGALARWLGGGLSVNTDDGFAVAATFPDPCLIAVPTADLRMGCSA